MPRINILVMTLLASEDLLFLENYMLPWKIFAYSSDSVGEGIQTSSSSKTDQEMRYHDFYCGFVVMLL